MTQQQGPYGARVYFMDSKTILVCQTRKRGAAQNAPYIVYPTPPKGRFVDQDDDKSIADAVRDALHGQLP